MWLDERDVLPELLAGHGDELAELAGELPRRLLDELGAVPSYYLRYFYAHDEVLAEQLAGATPRAVTVAEIERELLAMYADPALATKPALLEQRGGAFYSEAATRLVASLATGDGAVHVVDIAQRRARSPGWRPTTSSRSRRASARDGPAAAAPARRSPPSCSGWSPHVAAYERLAVQAAVTGEPPRRAQGAARAPARSGSGAWSRAPGRAARRDRRGRP